MTNAGPDGEAIMKSNRLGMFIALGAGVGMAVGAGTHNVGQGLALGVAFGVAIGMVAERKGR